jgi:hydrogenase maturation protease
MKTLVLGVGNPILQDDGVGLHVIEELRAQVHNRDVVLDTAFTGGLNLLDVIRGYDNVILVDAIQQEDSRAGEVKRLVLTDQPTVHSSNPHDVSLSQALRLAQQLGDKNLPDNIIIIGIVVKNTLDFGEHLSKEVQCAIPTAVHMVLSELKNT